MGFVSACELNHELGLTFIVRHILAYHVNSMIEVI